MLPVAAEMVASALFSAAVITMESANAQAILQLVPFAVTLAAAILLKERVAIQLERSRSRATRPSDPTD